MAPTRGDRAAIEQAAALIAKAERPVIMAGDAVAQSRAHAELVALAELNGALVYAESVPSTASFPASHPLFRGPCRPPCRLASRRWRSDGSSSTRYEQPADDWRACSSR